MRLAWPIEIEMDGIAYGYSILNRELRQAIEARGITISDDADIGVFVGPADLFDPQWPINVLFTMYETETIPANWVERCNLADLVLVPCKHNREAFKRSGVSRTVKTVSLGVHPHQWPTRRREESSPFRILFVGWPNQRKGLDVLATAFLRGFVDDSDTVLYLKTSQAYSGTLKRYTLGGIERLIIDDRAIPQGQLVDLYHSAHVFVLASRGEGWGLPAMEAMATGCPVVATAHGGLEEFVTSETGWPIRHGWSAVEYGHRTRAAEPDVEHLIETLQWIRSHYAQAAETAERAAWWVKERFTWAASAERLLTLLASLYTQSGMMMKKAMTLKEDRKSDMSSVAARVPNLRNRGGLAEPSATEEE